MKLLKKDLEAKINEAFERGAKELQTIHIFDQDPEELDSEYERRCIGKLEQAPDDGVELAYHLQFCEFVDGSLMCLDCGEIDCWDREVPTA